MKKLLQLIVITLLFFFVGCNTPEPSNLNIYLEQLEVQEATYANFYLPRVLNSEGDHVITWKSSNEEILVIGNIMTITGIEHYFVEVVRGEEDVTVNLTATIDMINGESGEKDFTVIVKEDTSIKEAKVAAAKELLAPYHDLTIRDSIDLITSSEEHGFTIVWKSNNENVVSSKGIYTAPENDTVVEFSVVVKEQEKEIYKETIRIIALNKNTVEKQIELDFASKFASFSSNWDSSYTERSITNEDMGVKTQFKVTMSRADKQAAGNAISDRPVIATKNSTEYITIEIKEGTLKTITFKLMQWSSKTFNNIHMEYYDGSKWVKCSNDIAAPGDLICDNLPSNVTKVRVSIYSSTSKNVQLGLSNINFELN